MHGNDRWTKTNRISRMQRKVNECASILRNAHGVRFTARDNGTVTRRATTSCMRRSSLPAHSIVSVLSCSRLAATSEKYRSCRRCPMQRSSQRVADASRSSSRRASVFSRHSWRTSGCCRISEFSDVAVDCAAARSADVSGRLPVPDLPVDSSASSLCGCCCCCCCSSLIGSYPSYVISLYLMQADKATISCTNNTQHQQPVC